MPSDPTLDQRKFDRMAKRLAATATCTGRWGKIAAALRRVDRAKNKREYERGYEDAKTERCQICGGFP